ncbi:AvrD family protein [Sphingobacterium hungaricum]
MKHQKELFEEIDRYLGDHNERYFSEGYKFFNFDLFELAVLDDEIAGKIKCNYSGPVRPRMEVPHLGSIEYTAIGFLIAEQALAQLLGLSAYEINRSTLRTLSIHIKQSILLNENDFEVPFRCLHSRTNLDVEVLNIRSSCFNISIGYVSINLSVDYPRPSLFSNVKPCEFFSQTDILFINGYKNRRIGLFALKPDFNSETIEATVSHPKSNLHTTQGISSFSDVLVPTDLLVVTGQLMQVLLYGLLKINRVDCPNIWLRSMNVHFGKPIQRKTYHSEIHFNQRNQLENKGIKWHAIQVESKLAHMQATFNICHQLQ